MTTGAAKDASRQGERRMALQEQSRILEAFYAHTMTPLVILDRHFNFIRVNEAYARSCQRNVKDFPGHNHFEFYPHEENEAIFREVVRTKIPYLVHAKPFCFPDHPEWGLTYWDWTLVPICDSKGEVEFLIFSLEDVTERQKHLEQISRYQKKLRSLTSELLLTEEQQRKHLATGLHDQVGPLLSVSRMKIAMLERSIALPDSAHAALEEIQRLLQQAVQYTRTLTFEMSPPRLYSLGLIAALEWLAEQMKELYGIQCSLESRCEMTPLPEETQVLVYQVVRELLNNVAKHAAAYIAKITIDAADHSLRIVIEDDGIGFNPQEVDTGAGKACYGLFSVRERLHYLEGDLAIDSKRGEGTRITVTVPLPSAEKGDAE